MNAWCRGSGGYGWTWGRRGENLNLRRLELAFDSAWAALASGLILAGSDVLPEPSVRVSGAQDRYSGVGSVSGVRAKLDQAVQDGARVFFLPLG